MVDVLSKADWQVPRHLPTAVCEENHTPQTGVILVKIVKSDTKKEEILEAIAEMNEPLIVVHRNVDADAVISAYLMCKVLNRPTSETAEIFVPSENGVIVFEALCVDYTPKECRDNTIVIDHHFVNREYKSCASLIYKIFELDKTMPHIHPLVDYADALDTAEWVNLPEPFKDFTLGSLINAMRQSNMTDVDIIRKCFSILEYYDKYLYVKYEAYKIANNIDIRQICGMKVAIVTADYPPTVMGVLFDEFGVDFIVYHTGNNIGVTRNAKINQPSLTKLADYIDEPGWFFHHAGFIACRGSRKHPATTPSKYTVDDLIQMLAKIF